MADVGVGVVETDVANFGLPETFPRVGGTRREHPFRIVALYSRSFVMSGNLVMHA